VRIVCVACKLEFRPAKNGVAAIESSTFGPYKLWETDRLACPGCGVEILSGFGLQAIAEHYQPGFAETVSRLQPELTFFGSPEERQQFLDGQPERSQRSPSIESDAGSGVQPSRPGHDLAKHVFDTAVAINRIMAEQVRKDATS